MTNDTPGNTPLINHGLTCDICGKPATIDVQNGLYFVCTDCGRDPETREEFPELKGYPLADLQYTAHTYRLGKGLRAIKQ